MKLSCLARDKSVRFAKPADPLTLPLDGGEISECGSVQEIIH